MKRDFVYTSLGVIPGLFLCAKCTRACTHEGLFHFIYKSLFLRYLEINFKKMCSFSCENESYNFTLSSKQITNQFNILEIMETLKLDLRLEAEERNLEFIETTSAMNGYPSNITGAIIGFETFEEAQELADELSLDIEAFKIRNGQQLWFRSENKSYEAFTNSAEDFGENYAEVFADTEEDFMQDEVFALLNDMEFTSFDDLNRFISEKKEIWEEIEKADEETQSVITREGTYYDTIEKNSMRFYDGDVNTYVIGLIDR